MPTGSNSMKIPLQGDLYQYAGTRRNNFEFQDGASLHHHEELYWPDNSIIRTYTVASVYKYGEADVWIPVGIVSMDHGGSWL